MDGLFQFAGFWLLYLAFATLAFWCWRRMFFWLERGSDVRRFFHMIGAVLLYTPAPITPESEFFAPVFVVLPFTALTSSVESAMYAVNWLIGGMVVGASALAIIQLSRWLSARMQTATE